MLVQSPRKLNIAANGVDRLADPKSDQQCLQLVAEITQNIQKAAQLVVRTGQQIVNLVDHDQNSGHGGSVTTLHAASGRKAIDRLALMIMSTGIYTSFENVRRYWARTIDVVVLLGRES